MKKLRRYYLAADSDFPIAYTILTKTYLLPYTFRRALKSEGFSSALKKAGIKDFRFHDLRHTFGSHLVMQGVDLRTVQQLMGHKEISITMRYSHLSPEYVQKAMERLDNLL